MKPCILFATFAIALSAQAPPAPPPAAPVSPDAVVAKVDGKDITAGELNQLRANIPGVTQALRADPAGAIAQLTFQQYLTDEARKLKLQDETPWKQQIEVATQNVLLNAMITYVRNHTDVTVDDVEAYFKLHLAKYQQARIKLFTVNFKPGAVSDPKNLESSAAAAFSAAHAKTDRSEADAKARAEAAVRELRAGADFAQIVEKYADDENKKSAAEDSITIKSNGSYPPEIQKAVVGLKAGDVPDPVRLVGSFYVIRTVEVTAAPLNDAREDILQTIRADRTQAYLEGLQKRFRTEIVRPDYFFQPASGKK
jgi:peptidyl-prolyl cis-trans isomerase C